MPRAARSVVRRMEGEEDVVKAVKLRARVWGGCLPWRGTRV